VTSTPSTSPLRRRIVVVSAATLAVGVLSAVAPAPAIEAASAATTTTGTVTTVATAGQVAAAGTVSAIAATPTARKAPVVTRVTATKVAVVAPYRFATVNYNKWWAKRILVTKYHVTSTAQFNCLVTVWTRESHWNHKAHNYSSGAHGIPQALPGSKMRTAGADWRTNPVTQIKWGLGYIHNRYGTPCGALRHMNSHGWY
jgi:resuscitation-promoting factor RpfB